MNTQNKLIVTGLTVDVDFMYSGSMVRIGFHEGREYIEYLISSNRRALSIKRFKNARWGTIIEPDFTVNPLDISEEEDFMVSILPGMNHFERSLYKMAGIVAKMWHNDADENYARNYVIEYLKDYLVTP
ncbi:hypothetical protein I4U30_22995 [Enterobacter asburiae]|uniref:Uncharacterized protein n=1 Tax=Cronobacter phage vB_CsaM_GAP31 TaxID=1141135 RepID=K4F5P4_9CAUD|nr:hypothetical protein [Enterobacter asburiae]YP_006986868.1 tail protein [Cronobacter phage vB_CsaM_GAP31]AFC21213.1 hypothetical protein GAP31_034 [Cronobacter phage vB_CsaM_GAP31]MBL5841134.1 hypothetical protein [Enterobacter asburiae]